MEQESNRTHKNCDLNNMEVSELKDKKQAQTSAGSILMYIHDFAYLLAVILVLFLLLFRIVVVSGSSMKSTLLDGDYLLLLSSCVYTEPMQGDVIVASKDSFENGEPIVKRVIATEGQKVDIDFNTGTVYVDDVALEEDYISSPTTVDEGIVFPLIVDEGCLFVMGDNRVVSKDSRSLDIGQIDCREVLGKAIFLFLPGTDKGIVPRDFSRIGGIS